MREKSEIIVRKFERKKSVSFSLLFLFWNSYEFIGEIDRIIVIIFLFHD